MGRDRPYLWNRVWSEFRWIMRDILSGDIFLYTTSGISLCLGHTYLRRWRCPPCFPYIPGISLFLSHFWCIERLMLPPPPPAHSDDNISAALWWPLRKLLIRAPYWTLRWNSLEMLAQPWFVTQVVTGQQWGGLFIVVCVYLEWPWRDLILDVIQSPRVVSSGSGRIFEARNGVHPPW